MFEYYRDIHVYYPGVGAYEPLGSNFLSESLIISPTAHFLQDVYFKWHFESFPIQMHWRPKLTLSQNRSSSSQGHIFIHVVVLEPSILHAKFR